MHVISLSIYLSITYTLVMSQCYIPNQAWHSTDPSCAASPSSMTGEGFTHGQKTAFYTFLKGPKYVHGVCRHIMYLYTCTWYDNVYLCYISLQSRSFRMLVDVSLLWMGTYSWSAWGFHVNFDLLYENGVCPPNADKQLDENGGYSSNFSDKSSWCCGESHHWIKSQSQHPDKNIQKPLS